MSHIDDELADFEREIEELAQGVSTAEPAQSAESSAVDAESLTVHAAPSAHLFISNAHAYAPPQLNTPAAAAVVEPSKPAYQP